MTTAPTIEIRNVTVDFSTPYTIFLSAEEKEVSFVTMEKNIRQRLRRKPMLCIRIDDTNSNLSRTYWVEYGTRGSTSVLVYKKPIIENPIVDVVYKYV